MDKRGPDDLTDRERDVLELLRRDFTNEQIAQRLDISLAGELRERSPKRRRRI